MIISVWESLGEEEGFTSQKIMSKEVNKAFDKELGKYIKL